jgi:hypothetical protein
VSSFDLDGGAQTHARPICSLLKREQETTAFLERQEWHAFSDGAALLAAATTGCVGFVWAVAGKDPGIVLHGCLFIVASAAGEAPAP